MPTYCNLYAYAANNPVHYIDPDGNDIIVFNRSYGAGGYGHNAVMVGNDKDGWIFYSKDDTDVNTRVKYNTLDDFLTFNQNAAEEDRYDNGVRTTTTSEQDKKMQEYGDANYLRGYSFAEKRDKHGNITQNCADLVSDIVSNADGIIIGKPKIEKGSQTRLGPYRWHGINFRNGGITSPVDTGITWPNRQLDDFRDNNITTDVEIR